MDHLVAMDQIREGIGLRGYAQQDPMVEYKKEGHERFELLVEKIYLSISERLTAAVASEKPEVQKTIAMTNPRNVQYQHGELESGVSEEARLKQQQSAEIGSEAAKVEKVVSGKDKVGRNDPCPCGSGKKYKHCHGR
jgi:preprotein translocase subunit SecA